MFAELTVVEIAQVLAGPAVGRFFSELGARVIKIENPATGGDMTRQWKVQEEQADDSTSAYYASMNAGKGIRFLDLKSDKGLAEVQELIKHADIVLTNFAAGQAERLSLDPKALFDLNPKLLIGRINGYGPSSPRPAYDVVLQAESGFMAMNGHPSGEPVKMPVALIDLLAAHQLKEGLLVALLKGEGQGMVVDVSLYDAALSSLANQASNWLMARHIPQPLGSQHPNIAPYGDLFTSKDQKRLLFAVGTDRQFEALCDVLGIPECSNDPNFRHNTDRVQNREQLCQRLRSEVVKFDREALLELLEKRQVPAGAVLKLDEVFSQPEAQRLTVEHELESATARTVKTNVFTLRQSSDFL